jgi:rod shape-determining protein MreD
LTARTKGRLRLAALLFVGIILQTSIGADLRVDRVAPDIMLLLAICAGLFGGARQGVVVGFIAGLLSDFWLITPLGLSALAFCLVGYLVGALRETLVPDGWVLVPVLAFVATAVGVVAFVGVGELVGQTQLAAGGHSLVVRKVLIESLLNTVASLPAAWVYARCARGTEGAAEILRGSAERAVR